MMIAPNSLPLLLSATTLLTSFTGYNSGPLVVSALATKASDITYKSWHELGHGIGDEYLYDKTGFSVASDAFGDTIAIGSPLYDVPATTVDGTSKRAGRVRLYDYNEETNEWDQLGEDIVGNEGDEFGTSIAMSVTGDFIAVGSPMCSIDELDTGNKWIKEAGCVRVYQLVNLFGTDKITYTKIGKTLYGTDAFDHFGYSVDIHTQRGYADEDVAKIQVAIGAPGAKNSDGDPVGKVFFEQMKFGNNDYNWKDKSLNGNEQPYVGKGNLDSRFGSSVSLSMDDGLLIVGAPMDNTENKRAGAVHIYKRDDDDTTPVWNKRNGLTYYGEDKNDQCGASVSITLRGDFFAYGCPHASTMGPGGDTHYQAGKVEVREIWPPGSEGTDEYTWLGKLVDEVIWGEHGGDRSGSAIDIGQDGMSKTTNLYIAIGAPNNYPSADYKEAGHVRVYHLGKDRSWLRANLDLNGGNAFDKFGTSVAISYDGHRMIAGAPGTSGYATSYELLYSEAPSFAPTNSPDYDGPRGDGGSRIGDQDDIFYNPKPLISPLFVMLVFFVVIPTAIFFGFKAYVQYRNKHPHNGGSFGAVGTNDNFGVATPRNDLELTPASSATGLGMVGVGVGTGSVEGGVTMEPAKSDII